MDTSTALQDLGIEEFHAYHSANGKSEVDSATGNVKIQVKNAVVTKNVAVNDADTFYQYCKSTLESKPKPRCEGKAYYSSC